MKFSKKLWLVVLVLFVMLGARGVFAGTQASARNPLKGFDAYVEKAMKEWNLPGLAVAVVKNDKVVLAKGYGLREIGKPERVDENTIFAIGSNTKAFTATALAMLVQENKLDWDDPVTKHLKGFQLYDPYVTREITVRDLLCHRSGLGRRGDFLWYGQTFSRDEILRRIRFLKPDSSFRSQVGYQNIMVMAAGQIIPAITGQSWDDFIKERLFTPLGMKRSNISTLKLSALTNVASPHTKKKGEIIPIAYFNSDTIGPAGSITSSALEMAQWLRLQLGQGRYAGKQLVDPAVLQMTRQPHTFIPIDPAKKKNSPTTHFAAYGLGWGLEDYHGRLIVRHNGGIDGMFSKQGFLPEEGLGIVVLTNSDCNALDDAIFYHLVDAYLGLPAKDWSQVLWLDTQENEKMAKEAQTEIIKNRVPNTKPSLEPAALCGIYESQLYGRLEVKIAGDKLIIMYDSRLFGALEHWHYNTFNVNAEMKGSIFANVEMGIALATFRVNSQGRVSGLDLDDLDLFERVADTEKK